MIGARVTACGVCCHGRCHGGGGDCSRLPTVTCPPHDYDRVRRQRAAGGKHARDRHRPEQDERRRQPHPERRHIGARHDSRKPSCHQERSEHACDGPRRQQAGVPLPAPRDARASPVRRVRRALRSRGGADVRRRSSHRTSRERRGERDRGGRADEHRRDAAWRQRGPAEVRVKGRRHHGPSPPCTASTRRRTESTIASFVSRAPRISVIRGMKSCAIGLIDRGSTRRCEVRSSAERTTPTSRCGARRVDDCATDGVVRRSRAPPLPDSITPTRQPPGARVRRETRCPQSAHADGSEIARRHDVRLEQGTRRFDRMGARNGPDRLDRAVCQPDPRSSRRSDDSAPSPAPTCAWRPRR